MTIRIEPYVYKTNDKKVRDQITYWGVYLDDLEISTTTTEEKALETKQWMENYLETTH